MPASFVPSPAEWFRILPEILLVVFGTLLMLLEPLTSAAGKGRLGRIGLGGLLAALWAAVVAWSNPGSAFQGMLVVDGFATFFRVLAIVVGILAALSSFEYLKRERAESGEYYALILYSVAGQCLMVSARELIMIFIGLEISSIATYVLAGYLRDDKRNNEAALKYFLLGSFATAFLLYGIAWTYGLTGTTDLTDIGRVLAAREIAPPGLAVGAAAALLLVGLSFKVSAAPFQVWTPDVYQGAPAPVSAFLSAGPKAAAFAVLLRVFMTAFAPAADRWQPVIWALALATMVVGNFAALTQTNLKRLLAYSSIAHAGYVLVAVTANTHVGVQAAMFYLASYAFMNVGAFAVVTHFARERERWVEVRDLAGLGARQPATAALMTIFLLSLIGVPLTAGFFGKFYIFKAALGANLIWLTILGLLNSAVAAYYYLRILVVMYMHEPGESTEDLAPLSAGVWIAVWSSAAATLILGVYPSLILDFAGRASVLTR
ncbi:MAG: NADH-quinone oxidoreductase subunit N [Acidobacteria bacterium]|nr:NADH-quinone oxidoreductase subunit N [Acidobacteriota bacterium]